MHTRICNVYLKCLSACLSCGLAHACASLCVCVCACVCACFPGGCVERGCLCVCNCVRIYACSWGPIGEWVESSSRAFLECVARLLWDNVWNRALELFSSTLCLPKGIVLRFPRGRPLVPFPIVHSQGRCLEISQDRPPVLCFRTSAVLKFPGGRLVGLEPETT